MANLHISLFGQFRVVCDERLVSGFDTRKVQELLCYLLLHRDRPHARETLAAVLFGEQTTAQSKKNLRQTIWRLQSALSAADAALVLVEPEWIRIDGDADFQLDVATFECAVTALQHIAGAELDAAGAQTLEAASGLYQDDLLAGWYQDWCLIERERLQNIYLSLVDKLMSFCESHHDYERGLRHGEQLLRQDRAHERTHRRMMRLHYLCGDRTAALRQYERCVIALQEELGVKPARRTRELYEKIRAYSTAARPAEPAPLALAQLLSRLKRLQSLLSSIQDQVQREIQSVEQVLPPKAD